PRRPALDTRPLAARDRRLRPARAAHALDGRLPVQLHPVLRRLRPRHGRAAQRHPAPEQLREPRPQEHDPMNWTLALPEIVLACSAMGILLFGVLRRQDSTFLCTMLAVAALILTGTLVLSAQPGGG